MWCQVVVPLAETEKVEVRGIGPLIVTPHHYWWREKTAVAIVRLVVESTAAALATAGIHAIALVGRATFARKRKVTGQA